ncbi:flavin-containing monooxygenase [Glycomyces xiaoerkulensis]|uniref:flavin-containing monooxygenase n=1 Tax=Glycomyces xiaoerkulensis TaxID=2038139 RepID=UPI001E3AE961|nr:NAD(P)-binding domain-containing protein [Glycomyces xiaoerkulensis]
MSEQSNPIVIIGAGQSGLVAARAARDAGLDPLVLEAGPRAAGSWPHYYDSLRVFSPARFSAIPGYRPIPADPDDYPARDEIADYLEGFAADLDVDIRTGARVEAVTTADGGYLVRTAAGETFGAAGVVAATGSFGNPHLPRFPGQEDFGGEVLHVADYRRPDAYAGKRVVVVGGGNSAVQVGCELAQTATVTLAARGPINLVEQRPGGRDIHHTLTAGYDHLPVEWFAPFVSGGLALDTGGYRKAFESGLLDRRPMFTAFDSDGLVWDDGTREQVDAVLLATGYRPDLGYLSGLGALDETGMPRHTGGVSTTHPGLAYVGLEFQRSFASNTLRGAARDAEHVMGPLAAFAAGLHTSLL